MNAVLEQVNSIGKAFVEFAVPMLVQSGVLIVILLLIDFVLRKKVKAVFRYCIWMLVLVKLVLPTSLSSPLSLGYWFGDKLAYVAESRTTAAPEAEVVEPALADMLHIIEPVPIEVERPAPAMLLMMPDVEPAVTEVVTPPATPVTPVTWQGVVFLLWLAVVIALGLLLLQRAIFVRGLVAQAKEANALMNGALEYCCKCMGVKRKVGLKVSANAASPAVCGLFRPVILLPHKLAPSLGSRGLRAVLLHELAHIRRGDLWVNLAQTVLQIMYFYNPLLWLGNAMVRRVREQAIDETVLVAMGEKAQQYPQTLVNVAKLAFKRPVLSLRLIGVVESKSALAGRIKHILSRPMPKSAKVGILGLLAVIVVGCALLPMARKEPHIPPTSTIDASGRIVDKIDYPFVDDPAVIGTWKSVDFVRAIADFESGVKHWPGDLYLKEMFIFEDGRTGGPWTWTKGLIIHPGDKTAAKYHIKEMNGSTYMFFEWKSGDYTIRHMKPRYYVLKKVEKRISSETAEPAMELTDAKYVATLSDGVTVELVGVCEHPSEGKQWWRPDGSLLGVSPYSSIGAKVYDGQPREFAVRLMNLPDEEISYRWDFMPSASYAGGYHPKDKSGKKIKDIWAIAAGIDEGIETVTVRFGVSAGKWQTQVTFDGKGSSSMGRGGYAFNFSRPYVQDNHTYVVVSDNMIELPHRVIAIDKDGKAHEAVDREAGSAGNVRQSTFGFKNLPIEDIQEFQFQTRPYEWVEFKNVSFRPGVKTDVQVEGEKTLSDVVELVVNANNLENRYVDLDTGTVFSYPKNMDTDSETEEAWWEQNKIDMSFLLADRKQSKIVHLWSCNMIAAPVSEDKWSCTEEELMLEAKKAEWERRVFPAEPASDSIVAKMDGDAAYPTFVFKTREGNVGVLQVQEILRNGQWDRQAKMRYWLLRNPSVKIEDDQIIWGQAVDGIVCAVKPVKESFSAGETFEFDITYKNVSGQPITICTYPDNFYVWTQLWIVDTSGTIVASGRHANGIKLPPKVSDFVTLQPGQTASVRQKVEGYFIDGKNWPRPGKYAVRASINEINKMKEHVYGFAEFCQKNNLQTWTGTIKSGISIFVITPTPEIQWGEARDGLRCRWVRPREPITTGTEVTIAVEVQNTSSNIIFWSCHSQITWDLDISPGPLLGMPKFHVKTGQGTRLATQKEVKEGFGIGLGDDRYRPESPMPGYYYFEPGSKLKLIRELLWKPENPGAYRMECEIARYSPTGSKEWGPRGRMTCPPLILDVKNRKPDVQVEEEDKILKRFFNQIDREIGKLKGKYPQLADWNTEKTDAKGFSTGKEISGNRLIYNHAVFPGRSPGSKDWCGENGCHIQIKLYTGVESPYMKTRIFPLKKGTMFSVIARVITGNPEVPELEQKINDIFQSAATSAAPEPDVQVELEYDNSLYQKQGSIRYALEFIGTPEELIDTTFISKHGQLANPRQLEFANKLFSIRKSKDVDAFISLLSDGSKKQLKDDDNNRRVLHHRIKKIKEGTFLAGQYDFKFFATFREFTDEDWNTLKKHVSFPETPTHIIVYWHFDKPDYSLCGSSYYLIEDNGSYKFVAQTLLSGPVIPVKEEQPTVPKEYGIVAFKQTDNAYTQPAVWKYKWNIELSSDVSENNVFQILRTTKVVSGQADLHPEIAAQKIIDESIIEKYKYDILKCRFYVGDSEPRYNYRKYGRQLSGWAYGFSIASWSRSTSMLFPGKDATNVKPNKQGNFVGSDLELLSFETSEENIRYEHKVILRKSDSPEAKSAALLRLEQMTQRRISNKKLQYLDRILAMYANDHNSEYPDRLEQIKPYDTDEWLDWLLKNIEYLGKGKILTETSKTVIAYDKTLLKKAGSTNVLFNDGPVQYCNPNWLKKLGITVDQKPDVEVEVGPGRKSTESKGSTPVVFRVGTDKSVMYTSIQEAIDAAPAGAVIRVAPGLYEERLKIDKPLTLEGAGWDRTTVMTRNVAADRYEEMPRVLAERMKGVKSDEERKAIIAEFQAEYKEKYGKPTLLVTNTEGVVIRALKVASPGRRLEGLTMSVPIVKFSNAKVVLSGCAVIASPGDGIHVMDGSDVEIRECLVAAVWGTGIGVVGGKDEIAKARILNCDVRNCHHRGIVIGRGSDSTVVERCRISGSAWHGIRYDNASPTIVGNLIFGNARFGIYASGKTAATVRNNVFFDNDMAGVSCWFHNADTIEGNTFIGNERSGLEILGASKPTVRKNIFSGNPTGVLCGNIGSDSAAAKSDGIVTLEQNLFWNNGQQAVWQRPKTADRESTTEQIRFVEKTGNIEADPLFTDLRRKDCSLRPDSPARRAGIGAADPIKLAGSWPLQPEEIAIIPDGDSRDSRKWKKQAQSAPPAKKPAISREGKAVPTAKSELQRLIDSARAGGTVIVPEGVYTEPIEITKSLTLKGQSRAACVFEVTADKPAIFIDTKGKGRVTIEAVTIKWQLATSDRSEYYFAVGVKDSKAEVKNCNFVPLGNFKRSPVAINAMGFSNLTINTCRFEGFEYTVCYGEGTEGTIQDSLVMGSGHQGISLYSGATVKIIRNVVTGSEYHGVRSTGGTLDMKDNLIIENANRGVYLGNKSAHGTITNNIITGNRLVGISGFAQSDVKIYNNLILNSGQVGIGAQPSCRFLVKDNIIKGNPSGIVVFLKEGARRGNLLIRRNTFWNNETDTENCEKAPQSISEEPAFRDPANGDFSLTGGKVMEQKQGLTDPKVFKALWKRWKNRADKTDGQVEGEEKSNSFAQEQILGSADELVSKDLRIIPVIKPHITIEHKRRVDTVLFLPNGKALISESFGEGVKVSDTQSGNLLRSFPRGYAVNSMAMSHDGATLVIGTNRGTAEIWSIETLNLEKRFQVTEWSIYAVALSPDSTMLASCAADGTVQLWDIKNSKLLKSLGKKSAYRMSSMSFSPDSKVLATLSRDGRADMWDVVNGQLIGTLPTKADSWGSCSITFCPDANTVAIATPGLVQFWKPENNNQLRNINVPDSINPLKTLNKLEPMSSPIFVGMVVLSRDCKKAASVIEDGTIVVWDVQTRTVQLKLVGSRIPDLPGGGIEIMAFSPDKSLFASGNRNGNVQLWKLADRIKSKKPMNMKRQLDGTVEIPAGWTAFPGLPRPGVKSDVGVGRSDKSAGNGVLPSKQESEAKTE